MRASIATDFLEMAIIYSILLVAVPWAVWNAGGLAALRSGIGGHDGTFGNVFDPWVAYSFGIPVTISLLSGPLGDQMQWQRSFVVPDARRVKRSFVLGAMIFVVVPLSLSLLGFTAAGLHRTQGWEVPDTQLVAPLAVSRLLPPAMSAVYAFMILCALCSTLDSVLCAVCALSSNDLLAEGGIGGEGAEEDRKSVAFGRAMMVAVAALGLAIAHIPGLRVVHLFLFYGTWRASTMVPTLLTLYWPRLRSRAVFFSILGSLIFGAPVLGLGNLLERPHLTVLGSLLVVLIGAGGCIGGTLAMESAERSVAR
jgi:Na+/proline symporter